MINNTERKREEGGERLVHHDMMMYRDVIQCDVIQCDVMTRHDAHTCRSTHRCLVCIEAPRWAPRI